MINPSIGGIICTDLYSNTKKIHDMIKPHFDKPYKEDSNCKAVIRCSNCDSCHTIYRPNHGLLHGLRQGFLALKIIDILTREATTTSAIHELNNKTDFRFRLQAIASFQRSGRLSETKRDNDADMRNFLDNFPGLDEYAICVLWDTDSIIAAHHLDLRRIVHFDSSRIKHNVCKELFCNDQATPKQQAIINEFMGITFRKTITAVWG